MNSVVRPILVVVVCFLLVGTASEWSAASLARGSAFCEYNTSRRAEFNEAVREHTQQQAPQGANYEEWRETLAHYTVAIGAAAQEDVREVSEFEIRWEVTQHWRAAGCTNIEALFEALKAEHQEDATNPDGTIVTTGSFGIKMNPLSL